MSESRDRLSRPVDIAAMYARRLQLGRRIGFLPDEPELTANLAVSPFRWGTTGMEATREPIGVTPPRGSGLGRGGYGTPRIRNGRGRNLYEPSAGRENMLVGNSRQGRGRRSTNSLLPSWYPRTPLRDITHVVQAIERRRARLREVEEGQEIDIPTPHEQPVLDLSGLDSGARFEHSISMSSPNPTIGFKRNLSPSVGKEPKISLDISNQAAGESDFLTPQKKLLNSIDIVAKIVKADRERQKKTPVPKKMEREKKVRTLMSMR